MTTVKISYLDISPRQTGKTERLITRAKKHLDAGDKVVFVTLKGLVKDVTRRLPGATLLADTDKLPLIEDLSDAFWFYDEFEWLKSAQIRPNAYYATTPKFLRKLGEPVSPDDLLLSLVEANDGMFCRHYWSFEMDDIITQVRMSLTDEEFRLLYLGEFYK